MFAILMMTAKSATLGLPKIKVLWNEGYDRLIYVRDVTNKTYQVTQIILQIW